MKHRPDPATLLRIEESEITRAQVRQMISEKGVDSRMVITMKPSPKIELLQSGQHVVFRGRIMLIDRRHAFNDPAGDFTEIALLEHDTFL